MEPTPIEEVPTINIEDGLVVQFAKLHAGRGDVWGAVEGFMVKRPLTFNDVHAHLFGEGSIGVYPLVDGRVHWGCSDIDVGYDEGWPLARRLVKALGLLGITGWIERTKGKGYHIWVYAQEWVPAATMRHALLTAHKIADVPVVEVNPKSITGGAGGNGNFVNLPYALAWVKQAKRVVVDYETGHLPLDLQSFIEFALDDRTSTAKLEAAASLWKEPERKHVEVGEYDGELKAISDKLTPLAWTIFKDGPLEGRDRSRTLARLAHLMAEGGAITATEALALIADADLRWCKFHERPDAERYLREIVENAYGRQD